MFKKRKSKTTQNKKCVNCILKTTYIFQAATKNVSDAISGWIFGAFAFTQFLISPVFGRLVGSFKYTLTCQNKSLCKLKSYLVLNTVRTCLIQYLGILKSYVVLNTVRTCLSLRQKPLALCPCLVKMCSG